MTEQRPYRGLTKEGKWVYGWYAKVIGYHYIIPDDADIAGISPPNLYGIINSIEVIPETVGQQVGEQDSKGQEIYKGDLFKTSDKHGYSSNCFAEVMFEDGAFVVQLYRKDEMEIAPELILDFKRSFPDSFEIIGNKWEHPTAQDNG